MHKSKARAIALGVGGGVCLLSGWLPLFGGPGYEAALLAGVVLPSTAAVATALEVSGTRSAPFEAFSRGLVTGLLLAGLGLVLSVLHGVRVGFCDLPGGVAVFALGPGVGTLVGGAWGAAAGLFARQVSRRQSRLLCALGLSLGAPIASIGISLWRFWSSPMVFAFDPFFGFFAGPLYDTVIEPVDRLESYRLGSLFSLLSAAALFFHLDADEARVRLVGRGRPGLALAGVAALAGSIFISLSGPTLGHWSTARSIRLELERSLTTERCEIIYAPSIPEREAAVLGRDCDAQVREIEAWFEARGPDRISVLLFESEEQKGRLMGAASTYIAKPWRREIYLQFARYPHPVLGHELAHVIAGGFGAGPFLVSGPAGGWIPDPGRIEGVATAATPSDDPELSLQEWSRAMQDLGLLPPLASVFRLSFLGENSSKAYTVAGAFVEWLRQAHGASAVRRWYAGEPLEAVTGGRDLGALERDWQASLAGLELSGPAREAARARFDRPAIFGRKCPHVVDSVFGEAHGHLGQGDVTGARERFERVLSLDPAHFGARVGLGSCSARAGDLSDARRRFAELANDEKLHSVLRMTADESIADLDLQAGDAPAAAERYRRIERSVADEDHLRTLDVKALAMSERGRAAIAALLVGDLRFGRDFGEAAARLGEWAVAEPDNGLPEYLLGRNFYQGGRYPEAARRLDAALSKKLTLPRVEAEALRMRLMVACVMEDRARAREALVRYRALPGIAPTAREGLERLARRCGAQ